MSTNANIQDSWSPEPELRDAPPRRLVNSGYDDFNKPNIMVAYVSGGIALGIGFLLFVFGMAQGNNPVLIIGGLLLLALGALGIFLWQGRLSAYGARAENLVTAGLPLPARILSSSNLTGDSRNGRVVKYQITLPTGELTHRDVNADERALPRAIPANVTALYDAKTGDVELYCVLPYRAVPKPSSVTVADPLASLPIAQPLPTAVADEAARSGGLTPLGNTPSNPLNPLDSLRPMGQAEAAAQTQSQTTKSSPAPQPAPTPSASQPEVKPEATPAAQPTTPAPTTKPWE